ncbi:hypothetical protein CFP56_035803 [Quercus suber]|uniref:DC1 domain-containing protein n=1 Tax=Quercus suber TaxID=58331 RepID=A0AAW0LR62_QUESU
MSLILQLHKPILRDQKEKVVGEKVSYMGIMNGQPEPEIHHFSHQHPLQLSNYLPQQTLNLALCSGCKLGASGSIYCCTFCSYFLHISFTNPTITSSISHSHLLMITKASHAIYAWSSWGLCDFDAHSGCATANPRPPLTQNCVVPASPYYQVLGNQSQIGPLMQNCMAPRAAPQFQTRYPVQNHVNYAHQGSYGSVGPIGIKQRNGMLNQAIKGISESLGLTLVQGLLGGGGGSNGVMNTSGGDASASEGGIFWGSIRIWRRRMKSMRSKE